MSDFAKNLENPLILRKDHVARCKTYALPATITKILRLRFPILVIKYA